MSNKSYILSEGADAKDRLTGLNKILSPFTESFFKKLGPIEGMKVLEIGCGTGNITSRLCEMVGIHGHVTALDISDKQIELAKERLGNKKLKNITFITQSVLDPLEKISHFDLVYSRLTLMHTSDPEKGLQYMYSYLKKDGIIACEEASNARDIHYPENYFYSKSRELLLNLAKLRGMDSYIGDKMYHFFNKLKVKNISVNFAQPLYSTSDEKKIILQFFQEVSKNYLRHEFIDEADFVSISKGLEEFINTEAILISFPLITQIFGQK